MRICREIEGRKTESARTTASGHKWSISRLIVRAGPTHLAPPALRFFTSCLHFFSPGVPLCKVQISIGNGGLGNGFILTQIHLPEGLDFER